MWGPDVYLPPIHHNTAVPASHVKEPVLFLFIIAFPSLKEMLCPVDVLKSDKSIPRPLLHNAGLDMPDL